MIDRDHDDLAQLRRRGPATARVVPGPDANGVLVGRVPEGAVVSPGPIVVMCEPLSAIEAIEAGAGSLTTTFDGDDASLVPIVLLGGTTSAGSILVARPVAGRWVADQGGGGGGGPLCGAVTTAAESLVAVITHGTRAGQTVGEGVARRCVTKVISESFVMHRVELPPFSPTALPGWPGSIYSPIAWPPPAEVGTFVPLVLSEHDSVGAPVGDPIRFYGYGSTNGVYFVSDPIQLDRNGLPSECYPPTDCSGFWLPNWITLVACCLPITGLGLVVVETAVEPTLVDGLPQLDLTGTTNFGLQLLNYVYGNGPRIGRPAPCASDGRGIGTGTIPLDWSGFLGSGYFDPITYPLELNGGFNSGLNGTWRGGHGCNARCVTQWISRIVIGEDVAPPPPDPTVVTITVCGCRCGDDCCPVSGVGVRYRDGLNDVSATTGADGTVVFTGLTYVGTGTGNATVDLTKPVGLDRFNSVTRYVPRGGGSHVVTLEKQAGYVCIGAFTPIADSLVFVGAITGPMVFTVVDCGGIAITGGYRTVMEALGYVGPTAYVHRLTIEAGTCAGTGDTWKIEVFGDDGEIGMQTGGSWSLEAPYFAGSLVSNAGDPTELCTQTFEIAPP